MAIPFLLENQKERINAVSNGNLGHVLKSSLVLKIFEGISIGSVLQPLADIFLEKSSKNSSLDIIDLWQFYLMLIMMVEESSITSLYLYRFVIMKLCFCNCNHRPDLIKWRGCDSVEDACIFYSSISVLRIWQRGCCVR